MALNGGFLSRFRQPSALAGRAARRKGRLGFAGEHVSEGQRPGEGHSREGQRRHLRTDYRLVYYMCVVV